MTMQLFVHCHATVIRDPPQLSLLAVLGQPITVDAGDGEAVSELIAPRRQGHTRGRVQDLGLTNFPARTAENGEQYKKAVTLVML
jgi:hypothetical protein